MALALAVLGHPRDPPEAVGGALSGGPKVDGRTGSREQISRRGKGVKPPDIVLDGFDGPLSYTLIDVKTLDAAGATHVAVHHTDTTRLAAHKHAATHCARHEYGQLPPRMRLILSWLSAPLAP